MTPPTDLAKRFLELHRKGRPLLLANAWDTGTARLLASLGFEALATTSAGHAGTLGRRDGLVTRDEALAHARAIAAATPLPVSADLERCFAVAPEGVAETLRLAGETGIAGASVEDSTGDAASPIHPAGLAKARVEAAVEAARAAGIVLTARCENYLHGRRDLADTIARLQAYEAAGADVLYAPALSDLGEIETLVKSVGAPVNVLCMPNGPTVPELASVGVARISVGSTFYNEAMGALAEAAREWREQGTHGFWQRAMLGARATRSAFEG
jgi:2-methylisocitrate lyase-like PEP mutase family enzyme